MIRGQSTSLHQATARVVVEYRKKLGENNRPLSFVRFAWELTNYTRSRGIKVSYQAVKFWSDGVHSPDYLLVFQLLQISPESTWQHAFAKDIMAAYHKELP